VKGRDIYRLLYLSDRRHAALISAVTALGLTLSFLRVDELLGPPTYAGVNIPDFEEVPIVSYGAGYGFGSRAPGFWLLA
jgi:hypothetical protein